MGHKGQKGAVWGWTEKPENAGCTQRYLCLLTSQSVARVSQLGQHRTMHCLLAACPHHSLPAHIDHPVPQLLLRAKHNFATTHPPWKKANASTHHSNMPQRRTLLRHESWQLLFVLQCAARVRSADKSTGVQAGQVLRHSGLPHTHSISLLTKCMHAQSTCLLMPILNQAVPAKSAAVQQNQSRGPHAASKCCRARPALEREPLLGWQTVNGPEHSMQHAAVGSHTVQSACTARSSPATQCFGKTAQGNCGLAVHAGKHLNTFSLVFPKVTHSQQPDLPILPPRCPPIGTLARQLHEKPRQSYKAARRYNSLLRRQTGDHCLKTKRPRRMQAQPPRATTQVAEGCIPSWCCGAASHNGTAWLLPGSLCMQAKLSHFQATDARSNAVAGKHKLIDALIAGCGRARL